MSGFEVVGVVLGVLPIVIEALKCYDTISKKVHVFRQSAQWIQKFYMLLRVQRQRFVMECHFLLGLVDVDERRRKVMIENATHALWTDKELNDQLAHRLGDHYQACEEVVKAIQIILEDLTANLRFLPVLENTTQQNAPETRHGFRQSLSLAFKEQKVQEKLAELRQMNGDLAHLRSLLTELTQRPSEFKTLKARPSARLPKEFSSIHQASFTLYEDLSHALCCGQSSAPLGHGVKLCLGATVRHQTDSPDVVCLDLAISHNGMADYLPQSNSMQQERCEPLMWLYVRSKTDTLKRASMLASSASPLTSKVRAESLATSLRQQPDRTTIDDNSNKKILLSRAGLKQNTPKKAASADAGNAAFTIAPAVNVTVAHTASSSETPSNSDQTDGIKLCQTQTLCQLLIQNKQRICYSGPSRADHCVGYLETPSLHKHVFYLGETRHQAVKRSPRPQERQITSVKELIQRSTEANLPFVNQLQLARSIAVAVLQYHSTPWLKTHWRLQDISFLGACDEPFEDQQALQTLHVSTQISPGRPNMAPEAAEVSNSTFHGSPNDEELRDLYGIRNITLGSLGLALLELGYRGPVDIHRRPKEPHDFVTARRLASGRPTPLGPRFQKVVQKCFQYDADISKLEVQAAVFEDVVYELERMIKVLTVDD